MIKNKNINEESKKAMQEFHEKQIKTNIKLHKIFLILFLLLDFGLFYFILAYKSKISEIKKRTNKNSSSISNNKDSINQNRDDIEHKILNIIANSLRGSYHFSFIFETKKEVDTVKNYLFEFYKTKNVDINKNNINMNFNYLSLSDGDTFSVIKQVLDFSFHNFFFIESNNHMKFGIYFGGNIDFNKKKKIYSDEGNDCFIISFQKEGIFPCIGDKNKLNIEKSENMIVIGDNDIIIKKNFMRGDENSGVINFPFKSFDVSTINSNIFTGTNGEFAIRSLEIFSFDFY